MAFFREKALLLGGEPNIPASSSFDYIYVGDEFCERRLPDSETISGIAEQCVKSGANLTLVTSYFTGEGIDRLKALLDYIILNSIACELVINDWGVLELLEDYSGHFRAIAGRLLTSRYLSKFNYQDLRSKGAEIVNEDFDCSFPGAFLDFLKTRNITALEFNNTNHLLKTHGQLKKNNIKAHIYLPYYYLNTSRYCSCARGYGSYMRNTDDTCNKECNNLVAIRRDGYLNTDILSMGNTHFVKEKIGIEDLTLDADRVIFNDPF
ncbi:MAG: hypothetical protein KKG43_07500 [Candidatus Omnitrophica bacterium]|nr:hypothetical protein [Candidatus Omnitrophota bacterium]MBU1929825.1 hypothetical protein [Candidatus Omnitrophota bacterium]MBU2035327.1 hypothetical protein [Candidatus Omnitrophota bacterium]MBU2222277.1 hypothetical protein [Candidatus Omnitrophota bacterium]